MPPLDNDERKTRFAFRLERDLFLLKTLINVNPWQYGEDQWTEALNVFMARGHNVTILSLKGRLKLLREQFAKAILPKTGTEEQKTERADLIREVNELVDAAKALNDFPLFVLHGADDLIPNDLEESPKGKVDVAEAKKQLFKEKKVADAGRDDALKKLADHAPEPTGTRGKRAKELEDELLIKKQEHDMGIENKKIALDEKREDRLREENQRRDEQTKAQLELQQKQLDFQVAQPEQQKVLMALISKVLEK